MLQEKSYGLSHYTQFFCYVYNLMVTNKYIGNITCFANLLRAPPCHGNIILRPVTYMCQVHNLPDW